MAHDMFVLGRVGMGCAMSRRQGAYWGPIKFCSIELLALVPDRFSFFESQFPDVRRIPFSFVENPIPNFVFRVFKLVQQFIHEVS